MVQINNECPLSLLEDSKSFNDYEYILPSFLEYPAYKKHMLESNKFKILDNGLFEKDTFSDLDLVAFIKELKPNIFITPDTWNDTEITSRNAIKWLKFNIPDVVLMPVLQGKNYDEMVRQYHILSLEGFTHFAINHSSMAYGNTIVEKMFGRVKLVNKLYGYRMVRPNHYIHLLGCSLPQEFTFYNNHPEIKSIDTSNPIISGIEGVRYKDWGLLEKPTNTIINHFNDKISSTQMEDIIFNIIKFKQFAWQK